MRFLVVAVSVFFGLVPASAEARQPSLSDAIREFSAILSQQVDCRAQDDVPIALFPFSQPNLPITRDRASALYIRIVSELLETRPDCVNYIDTAGASVRLESLHRWDALGDDVREQYERLGQTLSGIDLAVEISLQQRGPNMDARLTARNFRRDTVLASRAARLPRETTIETCGEGAQPGDAALRAIAERLVDRAPEMHHVVREGSFFADSDETTELGQYLERGVIAELTRAAENVITDRALQLYTSARPPRNVDQRSLFSLNMRYWLCPGDASLILTVQMESPAGRVLIEQLDIRTAGMPPMRFRPLVYEEWEAVQGSVNPDDIRDFLRQFAESPFERAARERLDVLDREYWRDVADGGLAVRDLRAYVRAFPDGLYLDRAQALLAMFDEREREREREQREREWEREREQREREQREREQREREQREREREREEERRRPSPQSLDGTYSGVRGYTDPRRPSQNQHCLAHYRFTAFVRGNSLTFHSDGREFRGTINRQGVISINRHGLTPRTNRDLWIRGHKSSATMYSGFCGYGFFRLSRQ